MTDQMSLFPQQDDTPLFSGTPQRVKDEVYQPVEQETDTQLDMFYTFHIDGGHGWLEVPLVDLESLDVEITSFSYVDRADGKVYLEEDLDASTYAYAKMQATNYQGTIQEWFKLYVTYINGPTWSPIRRLPSYK